MYPFILQLYKILLPIRQESTTNESIILETVTAAEDNFLLAQRRY